MHKTKRLPIPSRHVRPALGIAPYIHTSARLAAPSSHADPAGVSWSLGLGGWSCTPAVTAASLTRAVLCGRSSTMSWQAYVDANLVGTGTVTAAGIYDLQGNPWAYSPGFAVSAPPAPLPRVPLPPPSCLTNYPRDGCDHWDWVGGGVWGGRVRAEVRAGSGVGALCLHPSAPFVPRRPRLPRWRLSRPTLLRPPAWPPPVPRWLASSTCSCAARRTR